MGSRLRGCISVLFGYVITLQLRLSTCDKSKSTLDEVLSKNFSVVLKSIAAKEEYSRGIADYGNEFWQELRWIYVSRNVVSNFQYLEDMRICLLRGDWTFKCSAEIHTKHSKVLVGPSGRVKVLRNCYEAGCKYSVAHLTFSTHHLRFTLLQQQCASRNINGSIDDELLGGSSFEIFVRNNQSMTSCSTTDHFNDTYSVYCPIHSTFGGHLTTEFYLSIILTQEHFEGFSEGAKCDISSLDNKAIILDDDHKVVPVIGKDISSTHFSLQHGSWYTARWHVGQCRYKYLNVSFHDGIHIQTPPPFPGFVRLKNLNQHISDSNTSYYWTIEKTFKSNKDENSITITIDNSSVHHSTTKEKLEVSCISPHRENEKMVFVGDSHMRGFFNYFVSQSIYARNLSFLPRKHNVLHYGSFSFIPANFASLHTTTLLNICNNTLSHADHVKTTIFIISGHWDTTYSSLRNIIHDNGSGLKLITVVRGILQGEIPCKGIRQIVWFTATPYPLCSNLALKCNVMRGFRTNANLRAINEFYVRNLLRITPLPTITLSIIDVFNIIYPRVFLHEMEEVICNHHYVCREESGIVVVTPGAMAAIRAIEHAVCN